MRVKTGAPGGRPAAAAARAARPCAGRRSPAAARGAGSRSAPAGCRPRTSCSGRRRSRPTRSQRRSGPPGPRPPALDQGLPADLRPPLVAAVAARAPRLPRLPPARDLRGLDEAGRRARRLLGDVPRLRACHQRVPLAQGRPDARGARLRRRVEPAVRGGRPPTPRGLLPAARLAPRAQRSRGPCPGPWLLRLRRRRGRRASVCPPTSPVVIPISGGRQSPRPISLGFCALTVDDLRFRGIEAGQSMIQLPKE